MVRGSWSVHPDDAAMRLGAAGIGVAHHTQTDVFEHGTH
jgi:hypothetical protein